MNDGEDRVAAFQKRPVGVWIDRFVTGKPAAADHENNPEPVGLGRLNNVEGQRRADVELEQQHVAVFHDVFLAFHAIEAFFARGGDGTAFHQIVVGDGFGFDEAALEIGVNDAGRFGRGVARVNRPGADFLFAGGEIRPQAEQMIRGADQRADAGFVDAEFLQKFLRFVRRKINQVAFDLRADDDGFAGEMVRLWRIRALWRRADWCRRWPDRFPSRWQAKMVGLSVSRKKPLEMTFSSGVSFERERGFAGVEVRLDFFQHGFFGERVFVAALGVLGDAGEPLSSPLRDRRGPVRW